MDTKRANKLLPFANGGQMVVTTSTEQGQANTVRRGEICAISVDPDRRIICVYQVWSALFGEALRYNEPIIGGTEEFHYDRLSIIDSSENATLGRLELSDEFDKRYIFFPKNDQSNINMFQVPGLIPNEEEMYQTALRSLQPLRKCPSCGGDGSGGMEGGDCGRCKGSGLTLPATVNEERLACYLIAMLRSYKQ